MKRIAIILGIIGIIMQLIAILLLIIALINYKCETIDKNTDFWVRNCDYK